MNLNEVLESKIYVKENGSVNFKTPFHYIHPFLDAIRYDGNGEDIIVKTQTEVVNDNEGGGRNTAYGRINIEAKVLGSVPGFQSVIGMVYALELQKPIIKIYTGQNASACTNLTIFNADGVYEQSLLSGYGTVYNKATEYLNKKEAEAVEFQEIYNDLTNSLMSTEELNREIGRILRAAPRTRIGSTPIVQATQRLDDKESVYYIKPDSQCSKMTLYDAISQSFTNSKDILDKPTKTIQLSKLFNIFKN
ncbi:MAG: hypothetical protein P4L35_11180 [Ignavibacteriaceae bacterium]|nr:hypothetical protein [Ignavibacteriaceae bacterium]